MHPPHATKAGSANVAMAMAARPPNPNTCRPASSRSGRPYWLIWHACHRLEPRAGTPSRMVGDNRLSEVTQLPASLRHETLDALSALRAAVRVHLAFNLLLCRHGWGVGVKGTEHDSDCPPEDREHRPVEPAWRGSQPDHGQRLAPGRQYPQGTTPGKSSPIWRRATSGFQRTDMAGTEAGRHRPAAWLQPFLGSGRPSR